MNCVALRMSATFFLLSAVALIDSLSDYSIVPWLYRCFAHNVGGLGGDRHLGDIACVRQRLHVPARIHHLTDLGGRNDTVRQVAELGFELLVRHWHFDAA